MKALRGWSVRDQRHGGPVGSDQSHPSARERRRPRLQSQALKSKIRHIAPPVLPHDRLHDEALPAGRSVRHTLQHILAEVGLRGRSRRLGLHFPNLSACIDQVVVQDGDGIPIRVKLDDHARTGETLNLSLQPGETVADLGIGMAVPWLCTASELHDGRFRESTRRRLLAMLWHDNPPLE